MTSKEALEMIVVDLVPIAKENNKEEIEQIEKDLETLDLVWLWLHNYPLTDSAKQQIKEWFENE